MAVANGESLTAVVVIPTDDIDQELALDAISDVEDDTAANADENRKLNAPPDDDAAFKAEISQARDNFLSAVTITSNNLDKKFAEIEGKLRSAACVALDLEFSGLRRNNFSRPRILDTGSDRYQRLRQVVQNFKPLQVGLAIVQDNSVPNDLSTGGIAHVDVYSCFLNGGDAARLLAVCAGLHASDDIRAYPNVVFEQTAAEFLITNGFHLDDVFKHGLQYMNNDQEQRLRYLLKNRRLMFAYLHYAGMFYAERYGDGPRELRACVARIKLWWMKKCERMSAKQTQRCKGNNGDTGDVGGFRIGGMQTKKQQPDDQSFRSGGGDADNVKYRTKDAERLQFLCDRLGKTCAADNMEEDTFVLRHNFSSLPSYLYLHEAIRTECPYLWTASIGSDLSQILIFDRPASSSGASEQQKQTTIVFNNAHRFARRGGADDGGDRNNDTAVAVVGKGDDEKLDDLGEWAVQYCLGFTRLFRLISTTCQRRRIPLVAHNCLADLLYFYQHFHKTLPDSYEQFKADVHSELFPIVVDTKVLYKQYHSLLLSTMPPYAIAKEERSNVELREIFLKVLDLSTLSYPALQSQVVSCNEIRLLPKLAAMLAHNAAFDAFMTSVVFVRLGRRMWIEAHKNDHEKCNSSAPNSPLFSPASVKIDINWRQPIAITDYADALTENVVNRVPLPFAALEYIRLDVVDPIPTRFSLALIMYMKRGPLFMLQTDDESNVGKNAIDLLAVQQQQMKSSGRIVGCDETISDRRQRMCETDIVTREEYVPLGDNLWLILFTREDDYLRFRMRRRAEEIMESNVEVIELDENENFKNVEDPFVVTNVLDPFERLRKQQQQHADNNEIIAPPPVKRLKVSLDTSESLIQVCDLDEWVAKQLESFSKQKQSAAEKNAGDEKVVAVQSEKFRQPFAEVKWLFIGGVVLAQCLAWRAALKATYC